MFLYSFLSLQSGAVLDEEKEKPKSQLNWGQLQNFYAGEI